MSSALGRRCTDPGNPLWEVKAQTVSLNSGTKNKNKSKTFHKCHPVSWQQQKLLLAICHLLSGNRSWGGQCSQQSLRKTTCRQDRLLINTRSGCIFKAEPRGGARLAGTHSLQQCGQWAQEVRTALPPYLRSRADQTAPEQTRGRRPESCCREKTRPAACVSVAGLIGWNCGANELKAAVVAALFC